MKKIIALLMLILVVSCEKEGETKVNELYGTWTVTHLGDGMADFIALKPSLTSRYSARRCCRLVMVHILRRVGLVILAVCVEVVALINEQLR